MSSVHKGLKEAMTAGVFTFFVFIVNTVLSRISSCTFNGNVDSNVWYTCANNLVNNCIALTERLQP